MKRGRKVSKLSLSQRHSSVVPDAPSSRPSSGSITSHRPFEEEEEDRDDFLIFHDASKTKKNIHGKPKATPTPIGSSSSSSWSVRFQVIQGPHAPLQVIIPSCPTTDAGTIIAIGRSPIFCSNQPFSFWLQHDSDVSAQHAQVYVTANVLEIEDLGSMNGTFVDGSKISPHTRVSLGTRSRVQFGESVMECQSNCHYPTLDKSSSIDTQVSNKSGNNTRLCYVCGGETFGLTMEMFQVHVNQCLDKSKQPAKKSNKKAGAKNLPKTKEQEQLQLALAISASVCPENVIEKETLALEQEVKDIDEEMRRLKRRKTEVLGRLKLIAIKAKSLSFVEPGTKVNTGEVLERIFPSHTRAASGSTIDTEEGHRITNSDNAGTKKKSWWDVSFQQDDVTSISSVCNPKLSTKESADEKKLSKIFSNDAVEEDKESEDNEHSAYPGLKDDDLVQDIWTFLQKKEIPAQLDDFFPQWKENIHYLSSQNYADIALAQINLKRELADCNPDEKASYLFFDDIIRFILQKGRVVRKEDLERLSQMHQVSSDDGHAQLDDISLYGKGDETTGASSGIVDLTSPDMRKGPKSKKRQSIVEIHDDSSSTSSRSSSLGSEKDLEDETSTILNDLELSRSLTQVSQRQESEIENPFDVDDEEEDGIVNPFDLSESEGEENVKDVRQGEQSPMMPSIPLDVLNVFNDSSSSPLSPLTSEISQNRSWRVIGTSQSSSRGLSQQHNSKPKQPTKKTRVSSHTQVLTKSPGYKNLNEVKLKRTIEGFGLKPKKTKELMVEQLCSVWKEVYGAENDEDSHLSDTALSNSSSQQLCRPARQEKKQAKSTVGSTRRRNTTKSSRRISCSQPEPMLNHHREPISRSTGVLSSEIKAMIKTSLTADPQIYEDILSHRVFNFNELYENHVVNSTRSSMKCTKKQLMKYFDEQGISYK